VTVSIDRRALAASLRRLQQPDNDAMLAQSLRRVVDACIHMFTVTGSGLMLADEQGDLRYAVATDPSSQHLETAQLRTAEGPCVDAYVHDTVVTCADLATDPRYQRLARRLGNVRFRAVLGVPIHLAGITVGSLDVYADAPRDWQPNECDAIGRYAHVAEAMLTAAVSAEHAGELAAQLSYAVEHRAPIERGVGYLMARDKLPQADAFNELRKAARASRRKIGDVAETLLETGYLPGEADQR
jgi:signal transduction protein with GAF and PtsI domain